MKLFRFGKILKRQRIEFYRKKLAKNPTFFINQLREEDTKYRTRSDSKEVHFYPVFLDSTTDIKVNKLMLILSSNSFFLCSEDAKTENKKIIEYLMKLKNIGDHFYRECFANSMEFEKQAVEAYSEINSLLAASKMANNKRFKISPFFNYFHNYMLKENWHMCECQLEADEFVIVKYKLLKKRHKNYCFDPCILFGARKETLYIGLDIDDNYYYCMLKIRLLTNTAKQQTPIHFD